jgi:phosphonate ABC transporter permease subunit PhnE
MAKKPNASDEAAKMKKTKPVFKSFRLMAISILSEVIYAYGFQVTQMGFEEIYSERRQQSLTRVIRALFHPDILEYDKVETQVEVPFYTPCPDSPVVIPEPDLDQAYLVATPKCADPRTEITVEGFNLIPNLRGQLYFIPPSQVSLGLGTYETDGDGYFKITAKIPPRPSDQVQHIRTVSTKNVGAPRISRTAQDTWDKIIETVFLALLATTFGIIFAIPVSFMAARNIMRDITMPMSSLSLTIIGWPIGIWLGGTIAGWLGDLSESITGNPVLTIAGLALGAALIWVIIRWALPEEEDVMPGIGLRIARLVTLFFAVLLAIFLLYLIASLAITAGQAFSKEPGFIGMMGSFVENLGVILELLIAIVAAVIGGGVVSGFLGRLGRKYIRPLKESARFVINLILGALAGGLVCVLLGAGLEWIYQINNPVITAYIPALVGAALGILTVVKNREKDTLPIGMTIYYVTRTLLNGLRAIEALIWVIIFVVWVGIGPFAGVLALSLHTIAALGKLYSEQVESIMPGPLEAVKATGANRLQVIVYSVVPQIIPLYISFTMYRWDINVRMSTIIGFAGGGGIGFLLLQNINLLNYRAASTQMIAIAVVVALMDYLSSYMREKIV